MSFEKLSDFISKKMQLQHVYQPIMLIELLKHDGQVIKTFNVAYFDTFACNDRLDIESFHHGFACN